MHKTLVVMTGDRGLCGSYNSGMMKKAENRYKEFVKQGERSFSSICSHREDKQTLEISEEILLSFLAEETDAVELLYTNS